MATSTTSIPAKTCVLFVMERNLAVSGNPQLAAAQARALELDVPFAVITCVAPQELSGGPKIAALQSVEAALGTHNIPLITLVGEPQSTLPGAIHHLNPLAIMLEQTPVSQPEKLQHHPHDWPGAVIPIAKLQAINTTC